jgi:hypothetical protein
MTRYRPFLARAVLACFALLASASCATSDADEACDPALTDEAVAAGELEPAALEELECVDDSAGDMQELVAPAGKVWCHYTVLTYYYQGSCRRCYWGCGGAFLGCNPC